jgi:uncharacterized protein YecT (DUF1311 family)
MVRGVCATGLLAAALAAPAAGQSARCGQAGSMIEIKDCLALLERDVERELVIAWSAVHRNVAGRDFLDPLIHARYAAALDRAQAAWKGWRAVECDEVTGFEWWGGSGAGAAIRGCMIETTAARVRDLTARYGLDRADAPISHARDP